MKTKKTKKKADLPDLMKEDILKPLSVASLGTNGDPCFGKEYDLTTNECKMCGDSELCAIVFAQTLNKTRGELEKENRYKDMEVLIDLTSVKKYMRSLKRKDLSKKEIIDRAMNKFKITREDTREIYKSLTKKD
jgi:hypothetical protein